jgi:polyhydroxyalkanoate synthesis regulator phasin
LYAKKHLKKHRLRRCCFCHEIEILHFPDTVTEHIDQNILRLADQESVGLRVWTLLSGPFSHYSNEDGLYRIEPFPTTPWYKLVVQNSSLKEAVMFDQLEKAFLAGLGAVAFSKKKTEEFLAELKQSYRMSEEEGKAFLEKTQDMVQEGRKRLAEMSETEVKKVVDKLGLVSREEFDSLLKRVEELEEKQRRD